MREIKFRAWSKSRNEMRCDLSSMSLVSLTEVYVKVKNDIPYWLSGVKLMQFTGLKDKNGKEIYEGDIVNCNLLPLKGTNMKAKIEFIDGCFFIVMDNTTQFPICTNDYFLEVIGNIYENPKLI